MRLESPSSDPDKDVTLVSRWFDKHRTQPKEQRWVNNEGQYHRALRPAVIKYTRGGDIREEIWFKQGRMHRVGGAAATKWDGERKLLEAWYTDDVLHRVDEKPALTEYNDDGTISLEEWWVKGNKVKATIVRVF